MGRTNGRAFSLYHNTNDRAIFSRAMASLLETTPDAPALADGRKVRGDRTRRAILTAAVNIASVEGLEGLTIGRLATELEMSKSGLFAHFGSKEELQISTVRAAAAIFVHRVIRAPRSASSPASRACAAMLDSWLDYMERGMFAGGCFFADATIEMDGRPGPVRDAVAAQMTQLGRAARRLRPRGDRARRAGARTPIPSSSRSSSTRSASPSTPAGSCTRTPPCSSAATARSAAGSRPTATEPGRAALGRVAGVTGRPCPIAGRPRGRVLLDDAAARRSPASGAASATAAARATCSRRRRRAAAERAAGRRSPSSRAGASRATSRSAACWSPPAARPRRHAHVLSRDLARDPAPPAWLEPPRARRRAPHAGRPPGDRPRAGLPRRVPARATPTTPTSRRPTSRRSSSRRSCPAA